MSILCLPIEPTSGFLRLPFIFDRAVAQPGSALAWGARGRGFESRQPDHSKKSSSSEDGFFDFSAGRVRKWRAKRARSNATCLESTSDKLSLRRSRLDFGIAETECRQSRQPDHFKNPLFSDITWLGESYTVSYFRFVCFDH